MISFLRYLFLSFYFQIGIIVIILTAFLPFSNSGNFFDSMWELGKGCPTAN